MNDLEWLARHVHEWRGDYEHIGFNRQYKRPEFFNMSFSACHERYTRNQWQAERERLQNKPSWEDAPEWAEWLAQWPDGEWLFYPRRPNETNFGYCSEHSFGERLSSDMYGEILSDWRDTLEPRPEEQTMTKKEWKQDELPPIGEECEVYRNGEWELCEIIAHIEQPMGTIAVFSYGREPGYGISGVDCLIPRYFRPVDVGRSEEDRAVEEIQRDGMGICHISEAGARALFKAGYRKQEPSE